MKKMAILLIALMVIGVGFLSGCFEDSDNKSSDESKFIGTWTFDKGGSGETIYVLNEDMTGTYTAYGNTTAAEWSLSNGEFCLTLLPPNEAEITQCSPYHFESSDTLVFDEGGTFIKS